MKRKVSAFTFVLVFTMFIFTACATSSALEKNDSYVDFSMEDDLSWLQGKWKLTKWETENHGIKEDNTKIYKYQFLIINGKQKTDKLFDESASADGKLTSNIYSVEDYFMLNSFESGHSNKVNQSKNKLLLTREFALDPEVIFSYTFTKQ